MAKRLDRAAKAVEQRLAAAGIPRGRRRIKRHRKRVVVQGWIETSGGVGVVHLAASQHGLDRIEREQACASPTGSIGKALPVSLGAHVSLTGNPPALLASFAPKTTPHEKPTRHKKSGRHHE